MFFIYIIYSLKLNRYYIGTTDNIEKRLDEHNSKTYPDAFTAKGIPWSLELSYSCERSGKAYKLEKFIKKMKSKTFINRVIKNPDILDDICNYKL